MGWMTNVQLVANRKQSWHIVVDEEFLINCLPGNSIKGANSDACTEEEEETVVLSELGVVVHVHNWCLSTLNSSSRLAQSAC